MIIRRETLQAVLPATTGTSTSYFLDAVLAEPSHNRLLATDGHIMLVATDNHPMADVDFPTVTGAEFHSNPEPICIPTAIAKSMLATMPKRPTIDILATAQLSQNGSENTATIVATDLQAPRVATLTRDDRRFPAYERLLQLSGPTVKVSIAVNVLETMIKSAKAVSKGKGTPTVTLEIPTEKETVVSAIGLAITGDDVTVTGVAMPCRL